MPDRHGQIAEVLLKNLVAPMETDEAPRAGDLGVEAGAKHDGHSCSESLRTGPLHEVGLHDVLMPRI